MEFNDGDLNTAAEDYFSWELSIDNLNDTDHDGIPDFSDEPASARAAAPLLSLARGTTNLLLTISGDVDRLHHILESTNLLQKLEDQSCTHPDQRSANGVVALPPGGLKFWRARAQ